MKTKHFSEMFLLVIIFLLISHVQAAENKMEKITEDENCTETALTGLLTIGISLYYASLPVRWILESIFSSIFGSLYPYLDGLIGNVFIHLITVLNTRWRYMIYLPPKIMKNS